LMRPLVFIIAKHHIPNFKKNVNIDYESVNF
jgi:hypothetical protein